VLFAQRQSLISATKHCQFVLTQDSKIQTIGFLVEQPQTKVEQRNNETNKAMTAGFTQRRARGFNPSFNLVSVIVAVITFLFNSTPSAASCGFSDKTSGNYTVPSTGCQLSQMITVNGAMDVSGVQGDSPLRELAAMGGTPDASNPKRHFKVLAGKQLYLAYLRLTGGAVITNSVSSGAGVGGSILVDNNSILHIIGSIFNGGTLAAHAGACIGALSGTSGAIISVVRSTFQSNMAGHGGAFWIGGSSTVSLEDCKFISNEAQSGNGGAITCAFGCTVKLVGGNNMFDSNQDGASRPSDSIYGGTGGTIIFDTCRPGTFQAANPLSNLDVDQDFYGCLYACPAGKTTAHFPEYVARKKMKEQTIVRIRATSAGPIDIEPNARSLIYDRGASPAINWISNVQKRE